VERFQFVFRDGRQTNVAQTATVDRPMVADLPESDLVVPPRRLAGCLRDPRDKNLGEPS